MDEVGYARHYVSLEESVDLGTWCDARRNGLKVMRLNERQDAKTTETSSVARLAHLSCPPSAHASYSVKAPTLASRNTCIRVIGISRFVESQIPQQTIAIGMPPTSSSREAKSGVLGRVLRLR